MNNTVVGSTPIKASESHRISGVDHASAKAHELALETLSRRPKGFGIPDSAGKAQGRPLNIKGAQIYGRRLSGSGMYGNKSLEFVIRG